MVLSLPSTCLSLRVSNGRLRRESITITRSSETTTTLRVITLVSWRATSEGFASHKTGETWGTPLLRREAGYLFRLGIDDLPGADGVGDFREVLYVGGGIGIEHHQVCVQTFFYAAFRRRVELRGGISGQRRQNVFPSHRTAHEFEFFRRVVG